MISSEWIETLILATLATVQGPHLQNFVKWTFIILSQFFLYLFHMSANKLSYEKFTKELQKNYDVYNYLFVNKIALIYIPNTKVSKNNNNNNNNTRFI